MPTRLALGDGDVDVLHRAHDAAAGRELDGEVVDVEQRIVSRSTSLVGSSQVRRCGSTMSRRPSPSRLKQNTAIISASAGKERDPPFAGDHEGRALGDHDAPFRRRRAHAKADERQAGGVEDGVAHGERHLHHHDRHDVGQDVRRAGCGTRRCRTAAPPARSRPRGAHWPRRGRRGHKAGN